MSETLKEKRILLVDDDHDILTSMQAAFEPTGAVVDTASNGNKAVELAEKNQPDLVVLDMMLPGRSGFLVLERDQGTQAAKRQAVCDHDHRQPGRPAQDVRREPGRQRVFQQAGEDGQADRDGRALAYTCRGDIAAIRGCPPGSFLLCGSGSRHSSVLARRSHARPGLIRCATAAG